MHQQQAPNMAHFSSQQQAGFGMPQQIPYGAAVVAHTMSPVFGTPAPSQLPMGGMFPTGPRPAVPARSGAMKPSVTSPTAASLNQDPFGAQQPFGEVLTATTSLQPKALNDSATTEKPPSDPFASLVPGIGGAATDRNNMFKDFEMAKPAMNGTNLSSTTAQNNSTVNDPFAGLSMTDTFNFEAQVSSIQLHSSAVFFKLFSSKPILHRQIFSRPLKKDLHLESISDSAIFPKVFT